MPVNNVAAKLPPQVYPATFGRKGAGPIPLSGATAGEAVVAVINIATLASAAASFETTTTINGEIQQTAASDLSGTEFWFILVHK